MKKYLSFCCIILLSFFAVQPLFAKGYFPMHDDTQVARVVVMGNALKEGQFPVRIVSDLGYGLGYPIFNFYGPLPYYIGGSLYALGVDSVVSTKIMFGIGAVIAPITLFFLLFPIFGSVASVVGAILLLFAPYHAVQMYVRGSVGEYWAMAFIPLILYGFLRAILEKRPWKSIGIAGIALAATITSHTILGFLTCVIIGISTVVFWVTRMIQNKLSKRDVFVPVSIFGFGLVLSAFFWLPAFMEMSATSVVAMVNGVNTTFFDHFVCASQLWNAPWGFAGSAPGCIDGMSFKFGKIHVIITLFALVAWIILRKNNRMQKKNVLMNIALGLLGCSIFFMLPISESLWKIFPYVSFIQYPWRLLSFSIVFIAICGAYLVSAIRIPIIRICIAVAIIMATIFLNAKLFRPQYQYVRDSKEFESFEELRFIKSKISDEYLPAGIVKPKTIDEVTKATVKGSGVFSVQRLEESSTSLIAEIDSEIPQRLTIQKAWFSGWSVKVNGRVVEPTIENGLLSLNIQAGVSIIELRFLDTPVRVIGNWISIFGVFIFGVMYLYGKKANN